MSTLRFRVHQHRRDAMDVEAMVAFAFAPLLGRIDGRVSVKVAEPSTSISSTGRAYYGTLPRWARPARYAVLVQLPSEDHPDLDYGIPGVCWHASFTNRLSGETRDEHLARVRAVVREAVERGDTHVDRWPISTVHDWREAIVHTAAHEACHVAQFSGERIKSEVACEEFALARLNAWRATGC